MYRTDMMKRPDVLMAFFLYPENFIGRQFGSTAGCTPAVLRSYDGPCNVKIEFRNAQVESAAFRADSAFYPCSCF